MAMEEVNKVGLKREGSPYTEQECEDIIAKLEEMLDGEMVPEEQQKFQEMVENCQYCLEQYSIEKNLRKLLKTGTSFRVNNNLVSSIKNSISAFRKR